MTSLERHKELLKQSIEMIDDTLSKGLMNNPRAIGFATSAGSIDLLSILLHKLDKIQIGKIIEHQWFKAPRPGQKIKPLYERKIGVEFPKKEEIYTLLCQIEEKRNILAYGNPTKIDVEENINLFRKLKTVIEEEIGEKI